MAIASCNVQIVSRASGRSSVAAAAYRAGERLYNDRENATYDYSYKRGIVYTEILTPAHAPSWASNRQQLWNAVEAAEKQKNAQTAREIEVALPRELSREQNIALAREYAQSFVNQGMIADLCMHDKGDGNPHAHIMLTMRPLSPEGEWLAKCRKEYILDEHGEKIRMKNGEYKSRRVNTVDWDNPDNVSTWRETYQDLTNAHLEKAGRAERINVHSYEAQGIDKIPTIHLGTAAHHMEQRGIQTERGDINRDIEAANREMADMQKEMDALQEQRKEQEMEEKKQPDIWEVLQERSAQLEAERQRKEQQEQQRKQKEQQAERRLGQPRELSLEEQTRILIESGNTSLAWFGLDDAARKQALRDMEQTLLEKARQLDNQTPLKDTLGALREQTPLRDMIQEVHPPDKPVPQQQPSAWDSISARLSEMQAEQKLKEQQEAQRQEQRRKEIERLQERFAEQVKQHYDPAHEQYPPKPDVWKAIQERSKQLEAEQQSSKVWDTMSERLSQLREEQRASKQVAQQQEEQKQKELQLLREREAAQLQQKYTPVEPHQESAAEAYQQRLARQEALRAERQQAAQQKEPKRSTPDFSEAWRQKVEQHRREREQSRHHERERRQRREYEHD